jgi:integrase
MKTINIICKIDQRIIEKYLKEQRSCGDRISLSDTVCAGLKLIINKKSSSWTYAYRKRGYLDGGRRHPQRTLKLGDPVQMTPSEARLAADAIKAEVRSGRDPATTMRAAERSRLTEEARQKNCSEWLASYTTNRMINGANKYQRDEMRNVRLALQELKVADAFPQEISPRHIRHLTDLHPSKPATGRHRLGALSRFLDFLLDEEAIEVNPVVAISKRRRPKPPAPRSNFFSPDQLKTLWHSRGLQPRYLRYLRFMITTPLRAGEAAELTWDQVNADRAEINLSSNDTKNSEQFTMPLNHLSTSLITSADQGHKTLVFPLSTNRGAQMSSWSHFNKSVRKVSGLETFILHDLRRSFSTLMAENTDVSEGLIDSLLNHKQSATRGGVIRHYQQAKHLEKRRAVMDEWGEILGAFVAPLESSLEPENE